VSATQTFTNAQKRPRTLFGVQIARGIAATMVVLAHANLLIDSHMFQGWFIEGWCGVDFFFVLSGFIIFYANHHDIGHRPGLPLYLFKRFVRIYPIYWAYSIAAVFVHLALAPRIHLISWIHLSARTLISCALLYPTNVSANEMPVLPVAWTLSYEVLFYLMFGVLIALKPRIAYPLVAVWSLVSLANVLFEHNFDNLFLNLLFAPRNSEFLLGAVVGWLAIKGSHRIGILILWICMASGLALLAASWTHAHWFANVPSNNVAGFGAAFALIVFAAVGLEMHGPKGGGRARRLLIYLGDASYSIYLVHFLLIVIANIVLARIGIHSRPRFLIIVTGCIVAGCLGYRFIERPIMNALNSRFKARFKGNRTSSAAFKNQSHEYGT
jgi:exopolysaccharide production protein ExoZ